MMESNIKFDQKMIVETANKVLDEFTYNGKTIREWADMLTNPKTKADRIRKMSDEELAKWLWFKVGKCPPFDICPSQCIPCEPKNCWFDWLREEGEA